MNRNRYKRPESVLVVIYTSAGEVLLLERVQPAGFWQSVTGSLGWDEPPMQAARREVLEETGLDAGGQLIDCGVTNRFPILPAWRPRYAPDVEHNIEHVFRIEYPVRPQVCINPGEHSQLAWLPRPDAAQRVGSHTDRAAVLRYVPEVC